LPAIGSQAIEKTIVFQEVPKPDPAEQVQGSFPKKMVNPSSCARTMTANLLW
jgi:hypothetical protein